MRYLIIACLMVGCSSAPVGFPVEPVPDVDPPCPQDAGAPIPDSGQDSAPACSFVLYDAHAKACDAPDTTVCTVVSTDVCHCCNQ